MNKKKRQKVRERQLARHMLNAVAESKDSAELFFRMLEVKDKFDPYSRHKIRIDPCAYCGSNDHVKRTVDHIEPKSSGGSNSLENLVSSCDPCNNEKASMSLLEYLSFRLARIAD